ncbi:MAG: replicative DNA helicase [Nitrospirae bacterium]|nr:MAG: replicative DNA helicase [Nitrospirota bacterium]
MLAAAQEISRACCEAKERPPEILDRAQQQLFALAEEGATTGFTGMKGLVMEAFTALEETSKRGQEISGVPSGFADLDRKLLGFQPSDLIILAARPAVGKTAFGLNVAANAAVRHGARVAIFSLEMSSLQLALRMLCAEAKVDAHRVRAGNVPSELWSSLTHAASSLSQAPIFIDDSATLSPLEMRARARRLKREHGLDLIIVDYLQLMRGSQRAERRDLEIAEISRSLKGLAKELEVPVLALAQLSRRTEESTGGPKLSHLRESGSIEQDADVVLFLHRDPDKMDEEADAWPTEVQIAKHRNGPVGKIEVWFVRRYARFVSEAFEYEGGVGVMP